MSESTFAHDNPAYANPTDDPQLTNVSEAAEEATEAAEEATEAAEEATEAAEEATDGEGGYQDWTKDELQEELEARDLVKSGTKAELVARLNEDDAGSADE